MNKLLKKIAAIFLSAVIATLTLMVTFVLLIPTKDQVLDSLPKYEKEEIYSSGGLQNFTAVSYTHLTLPTNNRV